MWDVHEPLMNQPNVWHLIGEYASYKTVQSVTSELRNGHRPIPPGQWEYRYDEFPVNERHEKPFGLWARYIGPSENDPPDPEPDPDPELKDWQ
jgi:hypothetical protein